MLKSGSLRFLRDGGCRLSSQVLPAGYSENVLHLIRGFSSAPNERFTSSEVDCEFPAQDATDLPSENSDDGSEPSQGISAVRKLFEDHGPKKQHRLSEKTRDYGERLPGRDVQPFLFQIVLDAPLNCLLTVLDAWLRDGNRLERTEVLMVLFHLRKQRMYNKALKFMEWIERKKLLNFEERDYACHLDLIARNHGIEAAQRYIERVPKTFRNEVLYETLLVNCVCRTAVLKAEQVFKEIRDFSLPFTVSACNQMVLLYKRVARHKVVDILTLMEKENIMPSPLTYKLLIDLKGRSNDTLGMESVLNKMKDSGIVPDFATQNMVAKFYISGGLTEKAEEAIRSMEVHVNDNRHAMRSLLDLYAILGRPDDVARIWKSCREPKLEDFLAAIQAWGKLRCIEKVEETFEALVKMSPKLTSKYFNAMLNVYAENKLLTKGKEFLERMCLSGCPSGPLTWDALVKLYVNSGELAKADSFLANVAEENPDRSPLFHSYITLLKAYSEKGDILNAEKIFDRLKEIKYPGRTPPYGFLLEAYVNAQVIPHGFRERMRADNVRPSKTLIERLKCLNGLQKGGNAEITE